MRQRDCEKGSYPLLKKIFGVSIPTTTIFLSQDGEIKVLVWKHGYNRTIIYKAKYEWIEWFLNVK